MMIRFYLYCTALLFCTGLCTAAWKGLDCPVDIAIGLEDPNNVYSCYPNQTCCTKNLVPACCESKPMDQVLNEQLTLWGTLLGTIILLGLFIWFCRSDQSLLDAETPCLQKFCSCCTKYKKRGDDGHLHINSGEEDGSFGSSASLQSKSTVLLMHEEDGQEVEDNAANLEAVLEPEEGEEEGEGPPPEEGGEEGEVPPPEDAVAEEPPSEEGEAAPAEEETPADEAPADDGGADGE